MKTEPLPQQLFIDRKDCALVVIDVQKFLLPVIAENTKVVENIVKLIKFSHIIGIPIVLTEQQKLGATVPAIKKELPDTEPIIKIHFDCFGSGEFVKYVRKLGKSTLILTGLETHICVAQTALHALIEYRVYAVSDAMSSRSRHNWDIALHRMRQSGVIITSTEMLIFELLRKAGSVEYRAALKLVK